MKLIRILVLIVIFVSTGHTPQLWSKTPTVLKSGDVILISLNCYMCTLIERTTNAPYSHSGIVLEKSGKYFVAQALGNVHLTTLSQFLGLKRIGGQALVLRAKNINFESYELWQNFKSFEGLPFDSKYLWDDESLYCSEFVAKFFQNIYPDVLAPGLIDYGSDVTLWERVLGGASNQGEWGNSPGSLMRDPFFEVMGEL